MKLKQKKTKKNIKDYEKKTFKLEKTSNPVEVESNSENDKFNTPKNKKVIFNFNNNKEISENSSGGDSTRRKFKKADEKLRFTSENKIKQKSESENSDKSSVSRSNNYIDLKLNDLEPISNILLKEANINKKLDIIIASNLVDTSSISFICSS